MDIAHPLWWTKEDGKTMVDPMTVILAADVEAGKFHTARKQDREWSLRYLKALEAGKNAHKHMVWPFHCIVGTPGHGVVDPINKALQAWSYKNKRLVTYMWKGTNPKAEMYSAFKADVVVPDAPETHLNKHVLDRIWGYDTVVLCGQALSHCVRYSFTDMTEYFASSSRDKPKVVLVTDCASPVGGFEDITKSWLSDTVAKIPFVETVDSYEQVGKYLK